MSQRFDPTHPSHANNPPSPYAPPRKKGCGCWVWGCLTVLLIFVTGSAITAFLGYSMLKNQAMKLTSETPNELTVVEYSEDEMKALESRFDDLKAQPQDGQDVNELVLTASDINAMIASNENLKGKVFVRIENDRISGDVSLPLQGLPFVDGRYLNGSGTFEVRMENGDLVVKLVSAEVKGEPIPDSIMSAFGNEYLAKELNKVKEFAKMLEQVQELRVEDGKIFLKVKPLPEEDGEDAETDQPVSGDSRER